MKATELRIKNLVLRDTEIRLISFLDETYVGLSDDFEKRGMCLLTEIKPIPLTEEILLKCGFRKSKSGMYLFDKFSFDLSDFEFGVESDYYYLTISENIKYLHQLQNLYFALTDIELEINL